MSKDRFKINHFLVIKEAVDPKVANFVYNYFMMKRQVTKTFYDFKYVNPYNDEWVLGLIIKFLIHIHIIVTSQWKLYYLLFNQRWKNSQD